MEWFFGKHCSEVTKKYHLPHFHNQIPVIHLKNSVPDSKGFLLNWKTNEHLVTLTFMFTLRSRSCVIPWCNYKTSTLVFPFHLSSRLTSFFSLLTDFNISIGLYLTYIQIEFMRSFYFVLVNIWTFFFAMSKQINLSTYLSPALRKVGSIESNISIQIINL